MKIKATITNFNVNWQAIKSACMTTISKQAGDKEPQQELKQVQGEKNLTKRKSK